MHHAVLLADALLDAGSIGRVRTQQRVRDFQASRDCLFNDMPLAILVSRDTSGTAEWLAAALQDNHRAIIVGTPTAGQGYAKSGVPLPDTDFVLVLATGLLQRADGRLLYGPRSGRMNSSQRLIVPRKSGLVARASRDSVSGWGVQPDHVVQRAKGWDFIDRCADILRAKISKLDQSGIGAAKEYGNAASADAGSIPFGAIVAKEAPDVSRWEFPGG